MANRSKPTNTILAPSKPAHDSSKGKKNSKRRQNQPVDLPRSSIPSSKMLTKFPINIMDIANKIRCKLSTHNNSSPANLKQKECSAASEVKETSGTNTNNNMPNKTKKTKEIVPVMNENLLRLDWVKFTDLVVSLWNKLPSCVTGIRSSGNKLGKKTHRELSKFVGISNSHELLTILQDYIKEHDRIISTVADQIVNASKDEKKALEDTPQWVQTLEQRRGTLTKVLLKQCQELHADTCTRHLSTSSIKHDPQFKPDPDKHPRARCVYAFTRDSWLYRKDPQGLADKYALTYSEAVKMMTQAREMSTRKVRALTSVGDRPSRLSPALRPGRADWRLVDDRALTVQDNYISMSSQESVRALTMLVSLIDELKVHTNPAAWPELCRRYEMLGRQCSAIVLQRRWLRLQEMTHFAFLRYADNDALPPHALFLNVARIIPGVVNTRPMSWLEWVRAGNVQRFQEDDCETEEEQLNIADASAEETHASEVAVDTSATAGPAAQIESSNSDSDSDVALTIDESCNSELPTTENTAPLIDSIALLKKMDPCTVRSMIIFESDDEEDVLKEVERKEKEETNCDKIDKEKVEAVVENAPCLGGVQESNANEDLVKKEGLVEGSASSRVNIIFENEVVADKNDDSPPQSTVVCDDTADDALQTTGESDDTSDDALQTTVESDDTGDDALQTTVESDDTVDDALQTTVESDDTTVSRDTNQGAKEPELNKHPTKDDETNKTKDDKCETHDPRDEIESSDGEDFHLHYSTDTDTEDIDNTREEKDEEHETYERKYITTQLKDNPDFNKELNDQNLLNLECNKALIKLCVPVTVDLIRIDHASAKNVETSNNTNFTFLASKSKPSSTQHRYSTRSSLRSRNNQKKVQKNSSRNQKDIPNAPKTTPLKKLYSPAKKKARFENDTNDLDSKAESQVPKRKETFSRRRNKIYKRIRKRKYSTDSEADSEMTKVRREDFDSGSKIRSRSSESSKKQEQEQEVSPTRPFYFTGKDNNETVASPQPMEVDPEIDQDLSRPIEANTQIGKTTTIKVANKEGTNPDSTAIEAGPSSSTSRSGPVQTSEPDLESSRKKVVLTDIDSVRRNNRSLRTALVAPMAAEKGNDSQPEPAMTTIDLTDTTTADLNPPEASAESDAAADLEAAERAVLTDAQVLQMIDDIQRTTQVDLQQASLFPSPARGRGRGRGGARGGTRGGAQGGSWWSLKWRSLRSVRKLTEQIENKLTKATVQSSASKFKKVPQKYRLKKQRTFPSPPTADDGLDEWIRQKTINNQYFHFQPHRQNNTQPHTSNTQVPNTQNNGNTSNSDSEALNTTERTNVLDSPSTSNQTLTTTQSNEEIASEITTSEVNTSLNETQRVTLNMNDVVPQNESSDSSGQVESSKPNKPRRITIVLQDFVHQDPPLVSQSVENRSSNETQRLTLTMNDTVPQNQPSSSDQNSSSNETQRLMQTLNDIVLQNRPSDSNQNFENSSANLDPRYEIKINRNTVIKSLLNKPSTLPPINTPINTNNRSLLIDNCKIIQSANNEVSPESTNVLSPDKITVTLRDIPPTPVIKSKLIVLDASKINAKCQRQSNLNNDNNSAQNIKDNHSESTQTNSNLNNDNNLAQNKTEKNLSAQTNTDAIEISDDDDNSAIDEPTRWPMRVTSSGNSCIRYYQKTKTPAIKATTETNNSNKLKDKIVLNNRVLVPNDAGVYDFVDNLKPQTSTKDSLSNIIITDVRSQNLTRYVPNTQLKAVIDSEVSHATPTDQESLATNPPQQFQTNNPASSFQTNNPVPSFQTNYPASSFQSNNPVSSFQTTNPTAQFQTNNPVPPYQTQFPIVPQTNLTVSLNNVTQTSLNMSNLANNPEIATLTPNNTMPSINMPQTSFQGNMNTQNNSIVTQPTVNVVITPNTQSPFANNTNPIIRNIPVKAFANMPANANFGQGPKRITNACKHPILFMPEGGSTPILIQPGMTAEQPLIQLNQFPFTSM